MSDVSQIIAFRKGRAHTTLRPVPQTPPPAPPAAPVVPSAKVTLGAAPGSSGALASATYTESVQQARRIEIDTRPPTIPGEPWDQPETRRVDAAEATRSATAQPPRGALATPEEAQQRAETAAAAANAMALAPPQPSAQRVSGAPEDARARSAEASAEQARAAVQAVLRG